MSYYDFRNGDSKVYKNDLENNIWDDVENVLSIKAGHSTMHFTGEQGTADMIARLIEEGKDTVSMFHSKDDAYDLFEQVIFNQASAISDWMFSDRREFKNPRDYAELEIELYMDEPTGVQLNSHLEEQNSNSVRMILRRDYEATYGFHLETAYPTIDAKHPEPIVKQYDRKEILMGDFYPFHSNLHAISFLTDYSDNVKVSFQHDESYREFIRYKCNIETASYIAYLYEDKVSIKKFDNGAKEILTPLELEQQCPELSGILKDALYYQNENLIQNELEADAMEADGFEITDD